MKIDKVNQNEKSFFWNTNL